MQVIKTSFRVLDNFLLAQSTGEYVTVSNGTVTGKGVDKSRIVFTEQDMIRCGNGVSVDCTSSFSEEFDEDTATKTVFKSSNFTTRFKRT